MKPFLLAQTPESLGLLLEGSGRAREVFRLLAHGQDPFSNTQLTPKARSRLALVCSDTRANLVQASKARDGTTKLLLSLHDETLVETVVIPSADRTTLCVSSQVGCARACDFCLTATMGLVRNLSSDEILAQVVAGIRQARISQFPEVRNVVYMGMGEPLDNLNEVEHSLTILCDDRGLGFGARHVTVSSVGTHRSAIEQAAKWSSQLAWSLHAADDEVRRNLIGTAKSTVRALKDWFLVAQGNRPLFVECCLIDGINDRDSDIEACIELFKEVEHEIRFNLLPLNSIGRADLRPSPRDRVEYFRDRLRSAGHFCMIRKSRGQDERAFGSDLNNQ